MPIRSVDNASVLLQVESDGADPGASITVKNFPPPTGNVDVIVLHLTRNAPELIRALVDQTLSDPDQDVTQATSAINITGMVNVHLTSAHDVITAQGRSVSGWDFHFMQVIRLTEQTVYAGRTASEGYVQVNYTFAPAYPFNMQWCLDAPSDAALMPFYNPKPPSIFDALRYTPSEAMRHPGHEMDTVPGVKRISTFMDDHPARYLKLTLSLGNQLSQARARQFFLFRVVRVVEALSVFVARNEQRVVQPLASVGWSATWNARLNWRSGQPMGPFMDKHEFKVDRWVKGLPSDKRDQAAIINNPPTDPARTGNEAAKNARLVILDHPRPPNVIFSERWAPDIPRDFYR